MGAKAAKFLPAVEITESSVVPILWLSDKFTVSTGKFSQFAFRQNVAPETEFIKLLKSRSVYME